MPRRPAPPRPGKVIYMRKLEDIPKGLSEAECKMASDWIWKENTHEIMALGIMQMIKWRDSTKERRKASAIQKVIDKKINRLLSTNDYATGKGFISQLQDNEYDPKGRSWGRAINKGENQYESKKEF